MQSCEDIELMLQDYLDGYLLPSQREVLEGHVRQCASCRALLSGFTRIEDRLDCLGDVEVPDELSRTILAALPAGSYAPSPWRRVAAWGSSAAAVLLVVGAGFLAKGRYLMRSTNGERVVELEFRAPQAVSVAVVGDFNGWDPHRNSLVRATHEGEWRGRLKLPRGVYQYAFVIDGTTWARDPRAKSTLADGFGGENSLMVVDG